MIENVTNQIADWEDFWYNSEEDWGDYVQLTDTGEGVNLSSNLEKQNDKYYAECVDHLVSTMGSNKDV